MATITISDSDVQRADAFLTQYLTDKVPDADFSQGSALRDFVVKAMAYIFAFLESERAKMKVGGSLLLLSQQAASAEVDAAVDAFLSNLFLPRKTGQATRIPCVLHFSESADVPLSPDIRFFRTGSLLFVPDLNAITVIPASALQRNTNADGTIKDYTYTTTLRATSAGSGYNIQPGRFLQVDRFSPYFLYAENITTGVDGKDIESTRELIARAPTALSTRNLINDRSINQVLFETFPALERALAVGMGEAEMLRDFTSESVSHLKLHTGGFTDVYVGLPRTETVAAELYVGGTYSRADSLTTILRDPTVGANAFAGVRPGHVVNITQGLPTVPRKAVVTRATPSEIEVNSRLPFPKATDELGAFVTYSVGAYAPNFHDVISARPTGATSRSLVEAGLVCLPAGPVYRVKMVEIPETGVRISKRVNRRPVAVDEYQVVVENFTEGQSARSVTKLYVHPSYTGETLRVTYDTLLGYPPIQSFVTGRFDRVINANHLVRGYNPVYVSVQIEYQRKFGAKNTYTQADLAARVTEFVNGFDWTNLLDVSSISEDLKQEFPDIGIVFPFQMNYRLYAPDGQIYEYASTDVASIFPSDRNLVFLTNGEALGTPILRDIGENVAAQLSTLGVSDRTVRYLADFVDVYVWERGLEAAPPGYVPVVPGNVNIITVVQG